jgi:hypothetical protein
MRRERMKLLALAVLVLLKEFLAWINSKRSEEVYHDEKS